MQIEADAVVNALDILPRARALAEYIGRSWDVLSTISPEGFNQFRDALGTASGQLSFMYRHVEFILGNKNARLARAFRNMPHVWPTMDAALNAPSLYDEVIRLLARQSLAIAPQALQRHWSLPYAPDATVEATWLQVYADPAPENKLYKLAEALVQLADVLSQYRWRHFVSVQRLIGLKPGTGGLAGVGWLQHVTEHRFFPELWSVRTGFCNLGGGGLPAAAQTPGPSGPKTRTARTALRAYKKPGPPGPGDLRARRKPRSRPRSPCRRRARWAERRCPPPRRHEPPRNARTSPSAIP